jgi:hypothetical protein
MPENTQAEAPSMTSLVSGIIHDAERLVRQEVLLARRELQAELDKAKTASVALAIGIGSSLLAAVCLFGTVVAVLHEVAGLPVWASFLIVGAVLAVGAGIALTIGVQQVRRISVVPPQTAETLRENVQWLQNQT